MLCPLRLFLNWLGGRAIDQEDQEICELMKIDIARRIIKEHNFIRKFSKHEIYIHPEYIDIELQLGAKGNWEIRGTVRTEKAMAMLKKLNKDLNSE